MPSDVHFENLGGDEVDIRDALRLGERFEINNEGSYHDEDNGISTRQIRMDADGVRKVLIYAEQIEAPGGGFCFRVNGRDNNNYSNYYKGGTPDEDVSEVRLFTNATSATPWTGIIEIHSRDVLSVIARGARPGLREENLDYATWNGNASSPNIDTIRFMGFNGASFKMRRTQVFSIYTKERDHQDPSAW